MKVILEFARAISRTKEDARKLGDRSSVIGKSILLGLFLVGAFALFVPFFLGEVEKWSSGKPVVDIPDTAWTTYFGTSDTDCEFVASRKCPAHPKNPLLWKSNTSRVDKDHRRRVSEAAGDKFWVGAKINPELLIQARDERAFHLIIGFISADYRIWIDGNLVAKGEYETDRIPLIFPVIIRDIAEPMYVAIEIDHVARSPYPDFLAGHIGEGFTTAEFSPYYLGKVLFWNKVRPFAFFTLNLLIALLFIFFWSPTKKKQEYAYMALYAFTHALIQARQVDTVYRSLGYEWTYYLDVVLRIYEGGFGLFLALSFARVRRVAFTFGVPFLVISPWLIGGLFYSAESLFHLTAKIGIGFVPLLYVAGAVACLAQAYLLHEQGAKNLGARRRVNRLVIFSALMFGLVMLYLVQSAGIASLESYVILYRLGHFAVVIFLGAVIVSDYRDNELLLEKIPVSEFHQRQPLPEALEGVLLNLDLKGSERLLRHGAHRGVGGELLNRCMQEIKISIRRNGGVITHTIGDEVKAFFPKVKAADPLKAAFCAVVQARQSLDLMPDVSGDDEPAYHFRAGMAEGAIRPIWEESERSREPGWVEAGSTNPFTDAARYMGLEEQIGNKDETVLVLSEKDALNLNTSPDVGKWVAEGLEMKGKHDRVYRASAIRIAESSKVELIDQKSLAS